MARGGATAAIARPLLPRRWWGLTGASAALVLGVAGTAGWLATTPPLLPPPVIVPIPPPVAQAPAAESTVKVGAAEPVTATAIFAPGAPLTPAPDQKLLEKVSAAGVDGFLPIVGPNGRASWQVYAKPFDPAEKRPRVALLIDNLATSASETDAAIQHLPPAVSLAFMPYRARLGQWITLARAGGHEVLLDMPMEPLDPVANDPGPNALRSSLDAATNLNRLQWMMSQTTGYVGLVGYLGGRFAESREDMKPALAELKKRGLLYVDNHAAVQSVAPSLAAEQGMPFAVATVLLNTELSRGAIDAKLAELEESAKRNGSAVGLSAADQIVFERVANWAQGLEQRGLVLAPISAVVGVTAQPLSGSDARPGKAVAAAPVKP